ncbi:hypothetical protein Dimus_011460 [Dionaea muscipula]
MKGYFGIKKEEKSRAGGRRAPRRRSTELVELSSLMQRLVELSSLSTLLSLPVAQWPQVREMAAAHNNNNFGRGEEDGVEASIRPWRRSTMKPMRWVTSPMEEVGGSARERSPTDQLGAKGGSARIEDPRHRGRDQADRSFQRISSIDMPGVEEDDGARWWERSARGSEELGEMIS